MSGFGYLGATTGNSPGAAPPYVGPSQVDAGGSHGGAGTHRDHVGPAGEIYDSVYSPRLAGGGASITSTSYGARGGNGGGVVNLTAGTLQLDGQILAKGEARTAGQPGGAGGTVLLTAGTLAGAGTVDASGGAGDSVGAGGGGRVGLIAGAVQGFNPATQAKALGGTQVNGYPSNVFGGGGTVFTKFGSQVYGSLWVDGGSPPAGTGSPATPLPAIG